MKSLLCCHTSVFPPRHRNSYHSNHIPFCFLCYYHLQLIVILTTAVKLKKSCIVQIEFGVNNDTTLPLTPPFLFGYVNALYLLSTPMFGYLVFYQKQPVMATKKLFDKFYWQTNVFICKRNFYSP